MTKQELYDNLCARYDKLVLSKQEMADELGISVRTLNEYIREGTAPGHKKLGGARNAKVVFPLTSVVEYLLEDSDDRSN